MYNKNNEHQIFFLCILIVNPIVLLFVTTILRSCCSLFVNSLLFDQYPFLLFLLDERVTLRDLRTTNALLEAPFVALVFFV